jgi:hypothetical protein
VLGARLFTVYSVSRVAGGLFLPRALADVVAAIPLSTFIVVALVRFERIEGAYWFLPLYFFAIGLADFISGVFFFEADVNGLDAVLRAGLQSLPQILLGTGLWVCRPRSPAADAVRSV